MPLTPRSRCQVKPSNKEEEGRNVTEHDSHNPTTTSSLSLSLPLSLPLSSSFFFFHDIPFYFYFFINLNSNLLGLIILVES